MAAPEVSAVMMKARAAHAESQKLIACMRDLRLQATSLRESTAALMSTMEQTMMECSARKSRAEGPARRLNPQDEAHLKLLTARELEVLRMIGEGQRTKEIAFSLGITFKTAVTHRSNIMEKLGIHEGPRLVRFAIRTGICAP